MRGNRFLWDLTPDELKKSIIDIQDTYCHFSYRFYPSKARLLASRDETLGFSATDPSDYRLDPGRLNGLQKSIEKSLASIFPSSNFSSLRNDTRLRIQSILNESGVVPSKMLLSIFGSSQNNFGSDGADLDMCLFYPNCQDVSKEEKARLIGAIGEYLTSNHEVIYIA